MHETSFCLETWLILFIQCINDIYTYIIPIYEMAVPDKDPKTSELSGGTLLKYEIFS